MGRHLDPRVLCRKANAVLCCLVLAADQAAPGVMALVDHVEGVVTVLGLAVEGKLVRGLAVGHLVHAEPLVGGLEQARLVFPDIVDVVDDVGQGVLHVDGQDLPVGLALVEQRHDAEHLDLLDLAGAGDGLADLAHVERVVVAAGPRLGVHGAGVLPRLRERAVVVDVAVVREAVAHEAQRALLCVLDDGVEGLGLGDLELGVGPARDLDDHVEDGAGRDGGRRGGEQRDVVERRHGRAVVLNVHAVLEGILRGDASGRVCCGWGSGAGRSRPALEELVLDCEQAVVSWRRRQHAGSGAP